MITGHALQTTIQVDDHTRENIANVVIAVVIAVTTEMSTNVLGEVAPGKEGAAVEADHRSAVTKIEEADLANEVTNISILIQAKKPTKKSINLTKTVPESNNELFRIIVQIGSLYGKYVKFG